jgi:hypothetical protein
MTESKKDTKDTKDVIEEPPPEVEIPDSIKNIEGGTTESIAPEQLVEALKQQASHIEGGDEAVVLISEEVPTASDSVQPEQFADLPAKAEEVQQAHKDQMSALSEQVKDSKTDDKDKKDSKK